MLSEGISLLLVEQESDLTNLRFILGVSETVPLNDMANNLHQLYDAVFHEVYSGDLAVAERYLHAYNFKRAMIVHRGSIKVYGRDLNWMKAALRKSPEVVIAELPPPVMTFNLHEEKADPYSELGYR